MIHLEPMSEDEFGRYVERSSRGFAEGSPRYQDVPIEEAVKAAREEFLTKIMPQGFHTSGHFLWNIFEGQNRVGYLHLGEPQNRVAKEVFAWDLEIFEPFRRRGFAREAMVQAGIKLKQLGYTRVGLNVFGGNNGAIRLYESMGFRVTQVQMARDID